MPPAVRENSPRIGIESPQQRLETVVDTDRESASSENVEVLGHKPDPELFAAPNDNHRSQQRDDVTAQSEEVCYGSRVPHGKLWYHRARIRFLMISRLVIV